MMTKPAAAITAGVEPFAKGYRRAALPARRRPKPGAHDRKPGLSDLEHTHCRESNCAGRNWRDDRQGRPQHNQWRSASHHRAEDRGHRKRRTSLPFFLTASCEWPTEAKISDVSVGSGILRGYPVGDLIIPKRWCNIKDVMLH